VKIKNQNKLLPRMPLNPPQKREERLRKDVHYDCNETNEKRNVFPNFTQHSIFFRRKNSQNSYKKQKIKT